MKYATRTTSDIGQNRGLLLYANMHSLGGIPVAFPLDVF